MLAVLSSLTLVTVITISLISTTPPTLDPIIVIVSPTEYPPPAELSVTVYSAPILTISNVAAVGSSSNVSPVPATNTIVNSSSSTKLLPPPDISASITGVTLAVIANTFVVAPLVFPFIANGTSGF